METQRRQKEFDANVKKKADADRYAIEQAAEAEKTKRLRVAEAEAEQKRLQGIAAADAKRAEGTAEAEVIRLRGLAEAEAKEKLAEAFAKFGEAAVLDVIVKMLPELAEKIAEPMKSIDKLTVVDTGSGDGAARVSNYVTSLMSTAPEMVKSVTGLDFLELARNLTSKDKAQSSSEIKLD